MGRLEDSSDYDSLRELTRRYRDLERQLDEVRRDLQVEAGRLGSREGRGHKAAVVRVTEWSREYVTQVVDRYLEDLAQQVGQGESPEERRDA